MFTKKKQFFALILSLVGICLCFMITVVNQKYNGMEAAITLKRPKPQASFILEQKESSAYNSRLQQKDPPELSSDIQPKEPLESSSLASVPIAKTPKDINQNITDSNFRIHNRRDILDFIHRQCKKYGKLTVNPGEAKWPRRMVIAKNWKEHKLIYASNPKTGSTSFKKWVSRMQGNNNTYDEIKHVHQLGRYGNVQELFDDATERLGHQV